ncbi:MAG: helix-turn-helix domain-containing protein [Clostridiales bacterium]|nr:helix-turn-helix domain-containing protein [Clostridiales bacterium]
MDTASEVKKLRDEMGMNRKEFCDFYSIPYRTVVDWEAGKRKMPEYVFRLMEFRAEIEQAKVREDKIE